MCVFLCGEPGGKGGLHAVSTKDPDTRAREAANTLWGRTLLAKLGTPYLVAQDVQYHTKCFILSVCHVSSMGRALAFRADGPGSIPGPA